MEKSIGDARARMQLAAVELFAELGYDRTTAAQIAARAGVTERTFFRHFADKREILFDGEVAMRSTLSAAVAAAPAGLSPLEILFETFRATIPMLENNRAYSKPRHDLIAATPALREREMAKLAALTNALAGQPGRTRRAGHAGGAGCQHGHGRVRAGHHGLAGRSRNASGRSPGIEF